MRRAKIIATLGPATATPAVLTGLLRAGVDVARLNLSHGDHAEHARVIAQTRRAAAALGRPVAILVDLRGSKARIGRLLGGRPVTLRRGDTVTLTPRDVPGRPGLIPTSLGRLGRDVRRGDAILIDDGRIELSVVRARGRDVVCRVITGGLLLEHKGMNLPGTD